jgi:hypothetical protein
MGERKRGVKHRRNGRGKMRCETRKEWVWKRECGAPRLGARENRPIVLDRVPYAMQGLKLKDRRKFIKVGLLNTENYCVHFE